MEKETLKASKSTNVHDLAGAIAGIVGKGAVCEIISIGAAALNQSIKASIIARKMLSSSGVNLVITPAFVNVPVVNRDTGEPEEITGVKLITVVM
jgi:stage V sporulation protein SpoVS